MVLSVAMVMYMITYAKLHMQKYCYLDRKKNVKRSTAERKLICKNAIFKLIFLNKIPYW